MGSRDTKRYVLTRRERRQLIIWGSGAVIMLSSLFYFISQLMAGAH